MSPWWYAYDGNLIGAYGGAAIGVLGGILGTAAGVLAPRGKGRRVGQCTVGVRAREARASGQACGRRAGRAAARLDR